MDEGVRAEQVHLAVEGDADALQRLIVHYHGPLYGTVEARVDTSQRLHHTIAFADEATPTRKAKPAGVMGAEIWVKVGEPQRGLAWPPAGRSELCFLSVDTRTPYVVDYPGEDGGKTGHYMLRWVATTAEKGPWSERASATIGA